MLGKQGERESPPLGAEKEAMPPLFRACPRVLIPFIVRKENAPVRVPEPQVQLPQQVANLFYFLA